MTGAAGTDRTETLHPLPDEDADHPGDDPQDGPPVAKAYGPGDDALGSAPRGEDDTDVLAPVEDPDHPDDDPHHTPEETR